MEKLLFTFFGGIYYFVFQVTVTYIGDVNMEMNKPIEKPKQEF